MRTRRRSPPITRYDAANVSDPALVVSVPCPECKAPETVVVYRHFEWVGLICERCAHAWQTSAKSHPALSAIKPFKPVRTKPT